MKIHTKSEKVSFIKVAKIGLAPMLILEFIADHVTDFDIKSDRAYFYVEFSNRNLEQGQALASYIKNNC